MAANMLPGNKEYQLRMFGERALFGNNFKGEDKQMPKLNDYYYYYNDLNGIKKMTICLLESAGRIIARGIAICSDQDNFSRKIGRAIAHGRAMKVVEGGIIDDFVINRPEAIIINMRCRAAFMYKASRYYYARGVIEKKIATIAAARHRIVEEAECSA